jgi:hypothetical protein
MLGSFFGLVGQVFKWTFIVILILVGGHLVHWRGESVSDHVKSTLGVVEGLKQPAMQLADKAGELGRDLKVGAANSGAEKISAEERARLRKVFHN